VAECDDLGSSPAGAFVDGVDEAGFGGIVLHGAGSCTVFIGKSESGGENPFASTGCRGSVIVRVGSGVLEVERGFSLVPVRPSPFATRTAQIGHQGWPA
jgi:hypothetical protein